MRALQHLSSLASAPLVPVNCAAIPEGLQEAEMFGYEEGAFTGAQRQGSPGYIRRARRGYALSGRDWRHAAGVAGATAARVAGRRSNAAGSPSLDPRELPPGRGHASGSTGRGGPRRFPGRSSLRLRHMVFFLPPLRKRRNLSGILDAMLANLGGESREVRLTSAARKRLLEHNWPRKYA